jgi:hypothetical protein
MASANAGPSLTSSPARAIASSSTLPEAHAPAVKWLGTNSALTFFIVSMKRWFSGLSRVEE